MRVLRIFHSAVVTSWRARERELIAAGVDVELVCARAWNEGGKMVTLDLAGDDFVIGAATLGSHPNTFLFDPRPIWKVLGQPFDLIDIHAEPCSVAVWQLRMLMRLRGSRAPFLLYSAQNIDKRYPIPFRWMERSALKRAAGVSVCNSEAGRILRRKGLRGTVAEIGLGVDIEQFASIDREPPQGRLRVGYFGRLLPHKGVATAIQALQGAPELSLQIVGDGPQAAELADLAHRLGVSDQVDFAGFVSSEELPDRYREVDVTVVPSVPTPRWEEQFGRVVIESMAAGVPVLASRSGALTDVVGDSGVLVPAADARALRDALVELAADPQRWQRLRAAGLSRAADFTWTNVAAQYLDLYRTALKREAAPAPSAASPPVPESEPALAPEKEPAATAGLTVIVVAYGSAELLSDCLLPLAGEFPVVIVDNSSLSETRQLAQALGARYLDPGRNLGFGAAVNKGLALLPDGHDALLLNPDAVITAEQVRRLHQALYADAGLAVVGPAQVDPHTHASARVQWPFPSPSGAWLQAVGLGRLSRRQAGFVIGSVLAIKAAALRDVGGFDEQFFLYAEETDWQRRATQLGWRVAEVAEVTASHVGAGTGGDPGIRESYFHASHELYIRKHFGAGGWYSYRAAVLAGSAVRSAVLRGPAQAKARFRFGLYLTGPVRAQQAAPRPVSASNASTAGTADVAEAHLNPVPQWH